MDSLDLDERASRRGGVLTRADLDAAGLTSGGAQRALASGRLCSVRYGAFSTPAFIASLGGDRWALHAVQVRAALTMAGECSVASGASAAALHGMDMFGTPPLRPILTRPAELSGHGGGARRTRSRVARLPEEQVVRLLVWPVTGVARTVVDVARRQDERCAVVAGDCALRQGLPVSEIEEVLAAGARPPGIRRAREGLALFDERAESPLESLTRLALYRAGLPPPELQCVIGSYRVDFCWPLARLVLEVDGRLKYSSSEALFEEKRREDRIRGQGFRMLRGTWDDVVPDARVLCGRVFGLLHEAAA
jgi:very-short-patch-repair endonuclease